MNLLCNTLYEGIRKHKNPDKGKSIGVDMILKNKKIKNTKIGNSPYKKTNMILPQGVIQSKKVQDNCEI